MTNDEISASSLHGGREASSKNHYLKHLPWRPSGVRVLVVLLLLSLISIAAAPARAQSEEKEVKQEKEVTIEDEGPKTETRTVDTAAVFARLNAMNEKTFLFQDRARAQSATSSFGVPEPSRGYSTVEDASRDESVPSAPQSTTSDGPQFQFTPYLWFIGMKGDTGPPARTVHVDVRFREIFDELNFGFMGAFEARWGGKWRFLLDMNYANLSDDKGTPGPLFDGVQLSVKTFFIDPEIGYALVGNNKSSLDALIGIRYWHLSNKIELRRGAERINIDVSSNWVDLVGGLRAKVAISERAFVSFKADVGGLGSDLTYQFFGGLGVNVRKRLTAVFGYRYLYVNYRSSNNIFDVSQKGLVMGFGFRF